MLTQEGGGDKFSVEEADFSEICSPPSKYTYFREKITFAEAINVCSQFQGQLAITEYGKDYEELYVFMEQEQGAIGNIWLRWTDGYKEGDWTDFESRKPPPFPIPWYNISEPTGGIGRLLSNFIDT